MEERVRDWGLGDGVFCFKLLALWPWTSHMISVNLSAYLSEPEPVIPTALHSSQNCSEDQVYKHPGNCEALSGGRHSRSSISLTQLQQHGAGSAGDFLLHLCSPHPIAFGGPSLFLAYPLAISHLARRKLNAF